VNNLSVSSPRTWGCFWLALSQYSCSFVFPTHVGVFQLPSLPAMVALCLPHARGGVSPAVYCSPFAEVSSPRTWGCFCILRDSDWRPWVFPTHVGVFLRRPSVLCSGTSLPHARGGVSMTLLNKAKDNTSSPRTWGCFRLYGFPQLIEIVFPTHVGVFPRPMP